MILDDIKGEGYEHEKKILGYFENPEEETKLDEYIQQAIAALKQKREEINEDLRTRISPQVVSYFDEKGFTYDNDLVDDITRQPATVGRGRAGRESHDGKANDDEGSPRL